MKEAAELINEIFDTNICEKDYAEKVEDVMEWNSFMIMNFLLEMSERYQAEIDVDDISAIETVEDLLLVVMERRR